VTWPNATDAISATHNATKKTLDILNRYEGSGERLEMKNEKNLKKMSNLKSGFRFRQE
jgi:hypothetical protein